jgi:hypothetical protein
MGAAVLRATFVRTAGERDRVYVTRSNGSQVDWSFPTYGNGLPHDLVHLVVEACFGLRSGSWGRVDAGADPRLINADANRTGGKEKYAAFGPEQTELQIAEALAGATWWLESAFHEQLAESVAVQCRRLGVPVPDLAPEQTARVRSALARLTQRWRALLPKGSLSLTFRTDRPEESCQDLST